MKTPCLLFILLFSLGCAKKNSVYKVKNAVSTAGLTSTYSVSNQSQYFYFPIAIAIDSLDHLYVPSNSTGLDEIIKITSNGEISQSQSVALQGVAQFIASDYFGNNYVTYANTNVIEKFSNDGTVSTFAGDYYGGLVNAVKTSARFNTPYGLAVDKTGNVFVADFGNRLIRKINPDGVVTTLAGNINYKNNSPLIKDGQDTTAQFVEPLAITVDNAGNLYVIDYECIRKITATGYVSTLAGAGIPGNVNGTGDIARFNHPTGIVVDHKGNLYVVDNGNNLIRKITQQGIVTTLAGSGVKGFTNGLGTAASFNYPYGIAIDSSGNLYVADFGNNTIRKILTQ